MRDYVDADPGDVVAARRHARRSGSSAGSASSSRCCGPIARIARSCSAATTRPCSTSGSRRSSTPAPGLARSIAEWKPFADTRRALRRLARRYRLAIVSNIDSDLLADTVGRLQAPFSCLVTAEDARAYKPDPKPLELAHRAARRRAGAIAARGVRLEVRSGAGARARACAPASSIAATSPSTSRAISKCRRSTRSPTRSAPEPQLVSRLRCVRGRRIARCAFQR